MRPDQPADIKADRVGIASAVLCTIHCLVVPVLFLIKDSWSDSHLPAQLPGWWELLDYVFLVVSFLAVYHSAGHTGSRYIKLSLWIFWLFLAASVILGSNMHWLAYIASAGLVATHFLNIRRIHLLSKAGNS